GFETHFIIYAHHIMQAKMKLAQDIIPTITIILLQQFLLEAAHRCQEVGLYDKVSKFILLNLSINAISSLLKVPFLCYCIGAMTRYTVYNLAPCIILVLAVEIHKRVGAFLGKLNLSPHVQACILMGPCVLNYAICIAAGTKLLAN
ncbi:hypothetical protein ACJX0J_010404, partial [Zea mays]